MIFINGVFFSDDCIWSWHYILRIICGANRYCSKKNFANWTFWFYCDYFGNRFAVLWCKPCLSLLPSIRRTECCSDNFRKWHQNNCIFMFHVFKILVLVIIAARHIYDILEYQFGYDLVGDKDNYSSLICRNALVSLCTFILTILSKPKLAAVAMASLKFILIIMVISVVAAATLLNCLILKYGWEYTGWQ